MLQQGMKQGSSLVARSQCEQQSVRKPINKLGFRNAKHKAFLHTVWKGCCDKMDDRS